MELNYKTLTNEIIKLLEKSETIVLATYDGDHITARTMNLINNGLTIYFQTGKNTEKGIQIQKNSNVAMAIDNIQIESNAMFTEDINEINLCSIKFKEKFPRLYDKYADFPEEPTIICKPYKFKLYKFIDGKICSDILDIKGSKAYRI